MPSNWSVPLLRTVAAATLAVLWLSTPPLEGAETPLMRAYYRVALQGDLTGAAELFAEPETLTPEEAALRDRFEARFVRGQDAEAPAVDDPFVRELLAIYQGYWRSSLLGALDADEAQRVLEGQVAELLARYSAPNGASGPLEAARTEVERRGFRVLGGLTQPLQELMIWRTEELRTYPVELTDGQQPVEVVFLSDFVVQGWAHFATFGRSYSGGWAGAERLYCLKQAYELESEGFRVSYLQHEARHFADYARFPALDQIELEYRAKLTELAFADQSLGTLLENFTTAGAPNPSAPHAFASHAALRDLAAELFGATEEQLPWDAVEPEAIRSTARALLERNTAALERAGAKTTRGVVAPEDSHG